MLEYKLKKIPDIIIFSFAIPPTLIPLVFGYLWLFLLLYSIVVFVLFLFSRGTGLIINHKGISNLINLKHARWDVIGGYKDNVHFNDFFHKETPPIPVRYILSSAGKFVKKRYTGKKGFPE